MLNILRLFLCLISICLVHRQAFASSPDWTHHFYTDDSVYYQKLYTNGFEQRFWLKKEYCQAISRAEVVLQSVPLLSVSTFRPMTSSDLESWDAPYGLNNQDVCWFHARIQGLDLNKISQNFYFLKFIDKRSGATLYFEDYKDSVLPSSRFSARPTQAMLPGRLGATPVIGGGVFFRLWEPVAEEVHLYLNQNPYVKLQAHRALFDDRREHFLYLSQARVGDQYHYQYIKNGSYEELEVDDTGILNPVKIDPFAREITYERKGGSVNNYKNPRGIISASEKFPWRFSQLMNLRKTPEHEPWLIYQLWPLAFNPQEKAGRYQVGTFLDVIPKLDYLAELGVNAVELLPVHESRFKASWGYALDSLILIEKTLGTRTDLKRMVDEMHRRQLRVIFDVVINHVNNTLIRDPLSASVSTSKFYGGNTDWGPKPRFDSLMVRKWIKDSLMEVAREFHVDGFRYDMIEYVYIGSARGYRFVQEMNLLTKMENPRFYNSAEQLPDNAWATYPLAEGGLGFDSQWNDKFKNAFEDGLNQYRAHHRQFDPSPLIGSLMGYSNHRNGASEYHFGGPLRTVNYIGSHDFVGNKNPIVRLVSEHLSFETEGNNTFYRVSPLEDPNNTEQKFRQIHNSFTHATGKLAYGSLMTRPGSVLFFQGEEFAQDLNIENEWSYVDAQEGNSIPSKDVDIDRYVRSHRVPWEYLNTWNEPKLNFLTPREHQLFDGYRLFFKDLIKLKRNNPDFNFEDAKMVTDHGQGVISYTIGRGRGQHFVILNFGLQKADLWLAFPGPSNCWWEEVISSAHPKYGSTENNRHLNVISLVGGRSNLVRLQATSISIFSCSNRGNSSVPLYFRSSLNNWIASGENLLKEVSEQGDLYGVDIEVKQPSSFEFKIASQNWDIELGHGEPLVPWNRSEENLNQMSGFVSYVPDRPNLTATLDAGRYRFIFDIKNFRYLFLPVQ